LKRTLWLAIRTLVLLFVVLYLLDWAALGIRIARGSAYDTIQVDTYLSTPLKGNKAEYDYVGSQPVTCSLSFFSHGKTPCWWLKRHPARWE
jgi:hypothetical protein